VAVGAHSAEQGILEGIIDDYQVARKCSIFTQTSVGARTTRAQAAVASTTAAAVEKGANAAREAGRLHVQYYYYSLGVGGVVQNYTWTFQQYQYAYQY
jgi:hypothetical protein